MKVSVSAISKHRKLRFGIKIPLDLTNEFLFRLLGGFGYHGNMRSFIMSTTGEL